MGISVSLNNDGTIVAAGAYWNAGNGYRAGQVSVYQYNSSNDSWEQLGSDIDGDAAGDRMGKSVSLNNDGTIVAVSATGSDVNGNNTGQVRVYQYNSSNDSWVQMGSGIDGEAVLDSFGSPVSINGAGTIVAAGAYQNDVNGNETGHVRIYNYEAPDISLQVQFIDEQNSIVNTKKLSSNPTYLNNSLSSLSSNYIIGSKCSSVSFGATNLTSGMRTNSSIYNTINPYGSGTNVGGLAFFAENGTQGNSSVVANDDLAMLMSGVSGESPSVYIPGNIGVGTIPNNEYALSISGDIIQYSYGPGVKYIWISSSSTTSTDITNFKLFHNGANIIYDSNYNSYLTSSTDFINTRVVVSSSSSEGFTYETNVNTYPNILLELNEAVNLPFFTHITNNTTLNYTVSRIGNTLKGEDHQSSSQGERFGWVNAINDDGTIFVAGIPYEQNGGTTRGRVRVYKYISNDWQQLGSNINGSDIQGYENSQKFGESVSINGDGTIIAAGMPNRRMVLTYIYSNNSWNEFGLSTTLEGNDQESDFGRCVSLNGDGNILAIGAPWTNNAQDTGYVYVYKYNDINDSWDQRGQILSGDNNGDHFGQAIELNPDGSIIAIGAADNTVNYATDGYVRVYKYDTINNSWNIIGSQILGSNSEAFGSALSINDDGTRIIIGGMFYSSSLHNSCGVARMYEYSNIDNSWNQIGQDISGEDTDDRLGNSVSMHGSGSFVAIGAFHSYSKKGSMKIYTYNDVDDVWNQVGGTQVGGTSSKLGKSVSMSKKSRSVVVGLPERNRTSAKTINNVGSIKVYTFESNPYEVKFIDEDYTTLETFNINDSETYRGVSSSLLGHKTHSIKHKVGDPNISSLTSSIYNTFGSFNQPYDVGGLAFFTSNDSYSETLDISNENLAMLMGGIEGTYPRIYIPGNVGIGVSEPTNALEVNGISEANTFTTTSDSRIKTDIEKIKNSLNTVLNIEGYSFNFKNDKNNYIQYGVIAQQIEKIIPELVSTPDNESKYKSVDYNGIIPHLIEAVKEQQKMIDEQSKILNEQTTILEQLYDKI